MGTVVFDIIDTQEKQIVWRGNAADEIYADTRDEVVEEMVEEVDKIMDEFPRQRS